MATANTALKQSAQTIFALSTLLMGSTVAHADILIDASSIGKLVCNKNASVFDSIDLPFPLLHEEKMWRAVSQHRLAYYISMATGASTTPASAISLAEALGLENFPGNVANLRDTVRNFQSKLAAGELDGIKAFTGDKLFEPGTDVSETPWMFRPEVVVRCMDPTIPTGTVAVADGAKPLDLRLRGDVESLSLSNEDPKIKGAEAATFSFTRSREFLDDGSRKQTTTYAIKGFLGTPLVSNGKISGLVAYVGYELNRERVKPAPTLIAPATPSDGDTNVLRIGLVGHTIIDNGENTLSPFSVDLSLDTSYLFDFAKDSERFRSRVTAHPYSSKGFFGLTGFGGYRAYKGSPIWTRLDLTLIADLNVLTRAGILVPTGKETFGHMGARVAFQAFVGDELDAGPFVSAEFQYLARVAGNSTFIPNIERHSFEVGYRWWHGSDFALEVKGKLVDGINPDSFANENTLSVGFGIIF